MSAFRALVALILSILLALCGRDARADRPEDEARHVPRFTYDGLDEALSMVAWSELGRDLAVLQPMLARDVEAAKPCAEIATLRRRILKRMSRLETAGIPGSGPYGVLSHPAVLVNAIHFTLDEADRPLTMDQADELFLIGSQFVAEECERGKRPATESIALARLVAEADRNGRMLHWVRASLTPGQQQLLEPEPTRSYVGWSMFDACSVLGPHARAIAYSTEEQLLEELLRDRVESLGLTAAETTVFRAHLARFVSDLVDAPHGASLLPREHTLAMARQTVALRRSLLKEPSLRDGVRRRIARERRFWVPLRVATPIADTAR